LFVTDEATTWEMNAEVTGKENNMILEPDKGNLNYSLIINNLKLMMVMMIMMMTTTTKR
jgi:hypothetical protein